MTQVEQLGTIYYQQMIRRPSPDLDLVDWARALLAERRAFRGTIGHNTLGGYLIGEYCDADRLNDLSDLIDALELALSQE